MKLDKDVDPEDIAKATDGFVGADMAALCTEAAKQVSDALMSDDGFRWIAHRRRGSAGCFIFVSR